MLLNLKIQDMFHSAMLVISKPSGRDSSVFVCTEVPRDHNKGGSRTHQHGWPVQESASMEGGGGPPLLLKPAVPQ